MNKLKFYQHYRKKFGTLTPGQVRGLEAILDSVENHDWIDTNEELAYILATIYHETARTFQPIEEYGKGAGRIYGRPDPITGQTYYGRGYVQLTWKKNYQKFSSLYGIDLVNEPELALDPETSFEICSRGMKDGLFTGKRLNDYVNEYNTDYVGARRVINGLDKASMIAKIAEKFQYILEEANA